ncbi:MAG TPA: hypothetical protein VF744_04615 [Beijerinckiaceae bacterium]|jgi:hypothetical protein
MGDLVLFLIWPAWFLAGAAFVLVFLRCVGTTAQPIQPGLPVCALMPCALWNAYERLWYERMFPEKVRLAGTLAIGGLSASFGGGGGCGIAAFWLDPATRDDIGRQGLAFFRDAHEAAGGERRTYTPWAATPMPKGTFAEGGWYGLDCADLGRGLRNAIYHGAQQPGGFFARGSSRDLLVLPAAGIAAFVYYH